MLSPIKCFLVFILFSVVTTIEARPGCNGVRYERVFIKLPESNCQPTAAIDRKELESIWNTTNNAKTNLMPTLQKTLDNHSIDTVRYECFSVDVSHAHQKYLDDVTYSKANHSFSYHQSNVRIEERLAEDQQELAEFSRSFVKMVHLTKPFAEIDPQVYIVHAKMSTILNQIDQALKLRCRLESYSYNNLDNLVNLKYSITLEAIKLIAYFNHRLDMMIERSNRTSQ